MGAGRDERASVRAAQRGSASGIEALFRLHWPRAYRAAFLVVHDAAAAEDIAQEAFLAAVRNLDRFDRRPPFGPWLHRIVVNRAIDWTRARQLRGEAELVDAAAPEHPAPLDESLLGALAALPPEHRAVIVLRHLLEYTPGEIAELLGLPRGTVNSRLRRGLDSLKEQRVRKDLERIEIPGEHEARERSWAVVARGLRRARADAAAALVEAGRSAWRWRSSSSPGLLSPPGRAVLDEIREVVGVEQSAAGAVLVAGSGAPARHRRLGRLGRRRGRLEAAARNATAKRPGPRSAASSWRRGGTSSSRSTPDGDVRWSLARPDVRFPRWGGTKTDTRIAYLSEGTLGSSAGTARATGCSTRVPASARRCGGPARLMC